MNLRQITPWSKSGLAVEAEAPISTIERTLTLLVEGTALNMPEIDPEDYKAFRGSVGRLALQLPDRLPEDDQLALIRTILHEFENYRKLSEAAIK